MPQALNFFTVAGSQWPLPRPQVLPNPVFQIRLPRRSPMQARVLPYKIRPQRLRFLHLLLRWQSRYQRRPLRSLMLRPRHTKLPRRWRLRRRALPPQLLLPNRSIDQLQSLPLWHSHHLCRRSPP
jgi:hypothetical protein